MYSRWLHNKLKEALLTRRVLLLSGPRQCGKTTLSSCFAESPNIYRTLDNTALLNAAKIDPHDFVKHSNELMIIDEVQRCPELLQAVKMDVDNNKQNGRFLLTGSANIQSLPAVQESLAGRVRHLRLRSLAQGEIENSQPNFLRKLFAKDFHLNSSAPKDLAPSLKEVYIEYALRGGYPEALSFDNHRDRKEWYQDYITSLMQKDLVEITNLRRADSLKNLLSILAAWSARFMDFGAIGSGLSLSRPTLQTYVNALEILYIVERVPAWTKTIYDRVGKKEKLFMTDTGVMGNILNWNKEKVLLDSAASGSLLETYVFTQLAALIDSTNENYQLYHYRDKLHREIDFIIENELREIAGIEVKAGSAVSDNDFKHLRWFKENLAKEQYFVGIVLYTGKDVLSFGNGLWAMPINTLWNL
jgi:predicted AAA+ superfamily ATPase